MASNEYLLETRNLTKFILLKRFNRFLGITRTVKRAPAVYNVNIGIEKGEAFGLVGLPGCGKSTLTMLISKKILPSEGNILFEGRSIYDIEDEHLHQSIKTIFSDTTPNISRSESFSLSSKLARIIHLKKRLPEGKIESWDSLTQRKLELALALDSNPKLMVIDEFLKTLDKKNLLRIQGILRKIREKMDITYLFVHEDIGFMKEVCDRFAVMFRGRIVEKNTRNEILRKGASHPHTEMLELYSRQHKFWENGYLRGARHLSPFAEISGCEFHPLCAYAKQICRSEEPALVHLREKTFVACHFPLTWPP